MGVESPGSTLAVIQGQSTLFVIFTYRNLRIRIPIFKGLEFCKKILSRCKNRLRKTSQDIRLRPKKWRNSFMVQTPHLRACWIPIISTILRHSGVPLPPNELPGFSVAVCKISARSSSEYLPSWPRIRLVFSNNEQLNIKYQRSWFQGLLSDCPVFRWDGKDALNGATKAYGEIFYINLVRGLVAKFALKKVQGPFFIRLRRSCVPLSIEVKKSCCNWVK